MPSGVYQHKSPSKETVEKRVIALKGQRRSPEVRQKMSEAQKKCGNKPPSMKGVSHSDAFRQRCSQRRGEKAPWWGRHHSVETRIKLSEEQRGEKSHNWQGGTTPINKRERKSVSFKLWKEAVLARDNWTCQKCGQRGGNIYPHHIKSFARYPELRFDVDNGITLCDDCHRKTMNFGGRAMIDRHFQLGPGEKEE